MNGERSSSPWNICYNIFIFSNNVQYMINGFVAISALLYSPIDAPVGCFLSEVRLRSFVNYKIKWIKSSFILLALSDLHFRTIQFFLYFIAIAFEFCSLILCCHLNWPPRSHLSFFQMYYFHFQSVFNFLIYIYFYAQSMLGG